MESPPETPVETQWGPASWYFMQDGKSPLGTWAESQNEKIPPLLSVPCCVRWVPHKLAPGCQMLTWEISPTLHFHSLLPPLKKMGELGGGKGHPVDEFLQKLALVTVLEIHFLKALVCVCERALFCTLDQVLFSPNPPQVGNSSYWVQRPSVGAEGVVATRGAQCRPWGGSSVVRQAAAVGCVAQHPGRGPCGGWCRDRLG